MKILNSKQKKVVRSSRSIDSRDSREYLKGEGYEIGKVIGEGTYCKVREVLHNGQKKAVKIISRTKASQYFVNRFLPRELGIVTELNHPNIIKSHEIYDFEGLVYIFMDIAEGGDLMHYMEEREEPLSERRARRYFRQLLGAVRYLHDRQIAHRDIKCDNVLIDRHGYLKLTDFGFCRNCVDPDSGRRLMSETFCGSRAFAAPEIHKHRPYNPMAVDMWSLGVILYTMVTARLPFDDRISFTKMLHHQNHRNIHFPETLSTGCVSLLKHLLEPDSTIRIKIEQAELHEWITSPVLYCGTDHSSRRSERIRCSKRRAESMKWFEKIAIPRFYSPTICDFTKKKKEEKSKKKDETTSKLTFR